MINLIFTINAVLPLFLLMATGYFLRRRGFLKPVFMENINRFCFAIALPALLFKNSYQADPLELFNPVLIGLIIFGVITVVILSWIIVPKIVKDRKKSSAIIQGIFRSNAALFGLPLAINIFGEKSAGSMSLILAVVVPLFNIIAVIVLVYFCGYGGKLEPKKLVEEILCNKLIWGTFLGLTLSLLGWRLPIFAEKAIFDIAGTATPLAMLSLGGSFNFKSAARNLKYTIPTSFLRLIAVPVFALFLGLAAKLSGPELGCMYIIFASPAATSSYIMAQTMGSDGQLAGEIVVVTTILSLFTIFIGVYLLKMFMLI